MKTGMGVIKDRATKEVKFPAAATADDIYIVNKARIPTGINCARTDMSDYDDNFVKVASGEFVKLETYTNPESFGTDAKGATATKGKVLAVGVDGLWADAATTVASKYLYADDYVDNGHTLMKIDVLDAPIKNA
ncbi:MAG: hypothetical protein RSF40_01845 [Oscillospiraceae bacterium]